MGVLYLSIELCFDLIACILGIVLAYCAGDNYPKFYWGIIAFGIGAVFMWENIGWLTIVTDTPEYRFTDLLNIEKMLKWYVLASIVALFPTASLLPGYLTPFKILFFYFPPFCLPLSDYVIWDSMVKRHLYSLVRIYLQVLTVQM